MPYLFDIKWVMKQLQTKKVRPSDASVCQINLPSHLTEKWWLDSMEAGSPPMPGCCVCTPWINSTD